MDVASQIELAAAGLGNSIGAKDAGLFFLGIGVDGEVELDADADLLGFGEKGVTFNAFIAEGFIDALPGIALQLILIPLVVSIIDDVKARIS